LSATSTSELQDDVSFGASQSLVSGNGFEYIFNHPSSDSTRMNVGLLNTDNSGTAARLRFVKSRGAGSSNVTVADGDSIWNIQGYGDDGTSIIYTGSIDMVVSGTPSTGVVPSKMSFSTATTAGTATTGIEISNTQDVSIPNGNLTVTGTGTFTNASTDNGIFIDQNGNGYPLYVDGQGTSQPLAYFLGPTTSEIKVQTNSGGAGAVLRGYGGTNVQVGSFNNVRTEIIANNAIVATFGLDKKITAEGQYVEQYAATGTSGAVTIDLDTGNNFSTALSGAVTYTFSNAATSGTVSSFTLKVVNNGSAITWPASVDWPAGTAPTLSASGATDVFVFYTHDGGTTWYGFTAGQAMA